MKPPAWTIREVRGIEAEHFLEGLAQLRIEVFREFPYLYDGEMSYERDYLRAYFQSKKSFLVLCFSADTLVGASTAVHLPDSAAEFQNPFRERGIDPEEVCYYGESILLPELRGQGIGREFMARRERFARTLGAKKSAFCAVVRDTSPPGYQDLGAFWEGCGFRKIPGLTTAFSWKEIGQKTETPKTMQFWLKNLEDNK